MGMTLSEFDIWYRTRFRRTSSALTAVFYIFSDMLGVMLSIGWGFFLIKIYGWGLWGEKGIINTKSFITYWPYLAGFIVIFQILSLYPGISLAPAEELRRFTIGSFLTHGGIILSRYIERDSWDSITAALIVSFIFSTAILLATRSLTNWILAKTRLGGIPAVIYGSGSTGRLVTDCLLDGAGTGYVPALILDDEQGGVDEYQGIPIIHDTSLGPEIVSRYNIKMAMVAMPKLEDQKLKHLLNNSVSSFRYSAFVPGLSRTTNIWMSVRDFGGVLGLVTSNKFKMSWNLAIKRFMDIAIVSIGGIIILPFLLLIALLVKITSPGPVLFRHKRLGMNGKHFNTYKFRTMVIDSQARLEKLLESDAEKEKEWKNYHKLANDPRITRIGKILRRTSIDEFPQLINILKGEMTLVGPRPIVDAEVEKYGEDYSRIFSIRPGLTGLWQVSGRSNTNYEERIAYDTFYLQSWSIWMDLWVIFKTFGAVIQGRGAY
ncbi:MAG: undecaprenyl-phosphate galactose phosphotransferase WbaP [Treponema sp.]|jgi:Undecaprenyl-phosphate galactose phosphotransferase WbaP|nr:undecaprenyl-phosphate galactose phosphotransferase WbaP [Treponema sp.]